METRIESVTTGLESSIATAAAILLQGGVVAFPTETVYGLGGIITSDIALQTIFAVKGRPSDNPLIIHCHSVEQAKQYVTRVSSEWIKLANKYWPGPLTMVTTKASHVSSTASSGLSTIGIRVPQHPIALALLKSVGVPIAAPSANTSGHPSPTTAQHVWDDLHGKIPLILDAGSCAIGIESTVIDLSVFPPIVLRPGHITKYQVEQTISQGVRTTEGNHSIPKAPGMKYRHYAPYAHVHLVTTVEEATLLLTTLTGKTCLVSDNVEFTSSVPRYELSPASLYASFRDADKKGYSDIIVLPSPDLQEHDGLMNRIRKASAG